VYAEIEKNQWDPATRGQWSLPDFFGVFADFILLIDAGEDCGELDTALSRLHEIYLNDGVVGSYDKIWGRDVSLFCSVLEMLTSAGIPVPYCVEIIRRSSALHHEFDVVVNEMKNGESLAKALKATQGAISNPTLVAIIAAAESSGEFETSLIRLQRNQASARQCQIAHRS